MLELTDSKRPANGGTGTGAVENRTTDTVESGTWYLVRTKQHKELWVLENLAAFVRETYLPMARTTVSRWGRMTDSLAPLFPSYLFARFDLERTFYKVQRTAGVRALVCNGRDPAEVDSRIIADIKARAVDGIVEIKRSGLKPGQSVYVTGGPLSGFEAVFESYLSGTERVAILLASVRAHVRVVLPAAQVAAR